MEDGELILYDESINLRKRLIELLGGVIAGVLTSDPLIGAAVAVACFVYQEWQRDAFYHWGPLESTASRDDTLYA